MRHKTYVGMLVAIMVVAICYPAFSLQLQGATGIVKASSLRVRSEPNGAVIDKLPQGMTVSILGTQEMEANGQKSAWYRIEYLKDGAKKAGYASAEWIAPTNSGQAAVPATTTAIEQPAAIPSLPSASPAPGPTPVPPISAAPPNWLAAVHAGDPKSQDWTNLKNFWVKRYTDETFKYVTEANSLTPNLEPAEINAHLESFLLDAGTEVGWARNHANTYRTKGLDLSTPLTEKGDYVTRSLMADDLANTLQIYITAVKMAQSNLKTKK
jgi:hypothetical protein